MRRKGREKRKSAHVMRKFHAKAQRRGTLVACLRSQNTWCFDAVLKIERLAGGGLEGDFWGGSGVFLLRWFLLREVSRKGAMYMRCV